MYGDSVQSCDLSADKTEVGIKDFVEVLKRMVIFQAKKIWVLKSFRLLEID